MTGRGIDQILPHPGDPALRENVVNDARTYVTLAERANGPIGWPVPYAWPWGDALSVLDEYAPDVRLLNLETAVTTASEFAAGKAVHYRMNPANIECLAVARPDVCVLANNHVIDFGAGGLAETLRALDHSRIGHVGAGLDIHQAQRPALVDVAGGARILIVAAGLRSSGVPSQWAATDGRAGVAYVGDLSDVSAHALANHAEAVREAGDLAVVSLHWGSNWGYEIGDDQVRFAHALIDAGVDVVYGHSSHHPRPIEVYRGKLIIYGCGDLINDYEGIQPYRTFRDDLRVLYFASLDASNNLSVLRMVVLRARRMRLERAGPEDTEWLRATLERTSDRFGTLIAARGVDTLVL